jgi:mono/diheme cytochrome c family protein
MAAFGKFLSPENKKMTRTTVYIGLGLMALSSLLMSQNSKPVSAAQAPGSLKASMTRGQKVYAAQCLTCHMADGGGVLNMNPPLIKTKWVLGDKTKLIQIVLQGMSTGVEINGDEYHNVMAAHDFLTDQEIADVLTYIRNSFGNKAKAVTVSDVKSVRTKTKKQ